jgi:hypothetical protein
MAKLLKTKQARKVESHVMREKGSGSGEEGFPRGVLWVSDESKSVVACDRHEVNVRLRMAEVMVNTLDSNRYFI